MQYVSKQKLIEFGVNLLVGKGVPEKSARYISEMAVETEAFGIKTHGLSVLGYLDSQIPSVMAPDIEPIIVKEKGATVLIDGNNGFSQLAMKLALELAVNKAKENGIGMAAIRNCLWLGALGVYLVPIARKGFMAQLWAQTATCKDCAPFGGIGATFSTNPLALAFPAPGDPVIADISTATVSMGKVNTLIKKGEKAPEKIFMDKEGNLTDDASVVKEGGSIMFLGGAHYGYKGYGLSLWAEALTAMAGGSCNNPEVEQKQSLNLTVIDPDAFGGKEYYDKEMKRFIAHIKDNRLRPGFTSIRLPGEGGFRHLRESEEKGVPLDDEMLAKLNAIAEKNGSEALKID